MSNHDVSPSAETRIDEAADIAPGCTGAYEVGDVENAPLVRRDANAPALSADRTNGDGWLNRCKLKRFVLACIVAVLVSATSLVLLRMSTVFRFGVGRPVDEIKGLSPSEVFHCSPRSGMQCSMKLGLSSTVPLDDDIVNINSRARGIVNPATRRFALKALLHARMTLDSATEVMSISGIGLGNHSLQNVTILIMGDSLDRYTLKAVQQIEGFVCSDDVSPGDLVADEHALSNVNHGFECRRCVNEKSGVVALLVWHAWGFYPYGPVHWVAPQGIGCDNWWLERY